MERLTALLLDTSVVEIDGLVTEYGPDAAFHPLTGSLAGMLDTDLAADDPLGGVEPRFRAGVTGTPWRLEARVYRDDWALLFWYEHTGTGEAVRAVARVDVVEGSVARLSNYFYTPDVIAEVCAELNVPWHTNGYRYWSTASTAEVAR